MITEWTFDPAVLVLVVALVATYALGLRRRHKRAEVWPFWRTAVFGLGILTMVVTSLGYLGAQSHTLFWAYTLQINVLLMIAPVLIVLGRPLELFGIDWQSRLRRSRWTRLLFHPAICPMLIPVVLTLVFFTSWMQLSLEHRSLYELTQIALLLIGSLFALCFITERKNESTTLIMAVMAAAFVEFLVDGVPGFVLRISDQLLLPTYYLHVAAHAGPSPLNDQHLGGALMWGIADSVDAPFLALLIARWIRADNREDRSMEVAVDSIFEDQGEPEGMWWERELDTYSARRAAYLRRRSGGSSN